MTSKRGITRAGSCVLRCVTPRAAAIPLLLILSCSASAPPLACPSPSTPSPTTGKDNWSVSVAENGDVLVVHIARGERHEHVAGHIDGDHDPSDVHGSTDLASYDYDGDGSTELFVKLWVDGYEPRVVSRLFLTDRGGTIVPYAPAASLHPKWVVDGLRDVDGDGRPDLDAVYELGAFKGCDFCAGSDIGHRFVAHARDDGTFSVDDLIARAEVKRQCPSPSAAPLVQNPLEPISTSEIFCARMWGRSREDTLAAITRECAPFAPTSAACAGPCKYQELDEAIAKFDPPFDLSR